MIPFRLPAACALLFAAASLALAPPHPTSAAETASHAKKHHRHAKPTPKPDAAAAAPVSAPGPAQSLGTSGAWSAYESKDQTGRVCYLVGQPQKSDPPGVKRKQPALMVTHRPEEKIANVVSFMEGYTLKDGSDAQLAVGDARFDLFTKDDSAWARTSEIDKAITIALSRGKQAVLKAAPARGPATTDVYSLNGFPQALGLIDKACGVKR